jgi:hypothetical protein
MEFLEVQVSPSYGTCEMMEIYVLSRRREVTLRRRRREGKAA